MTRRLSQLLLSPESLTKQHDGPKSGFLVIQDDESETYMCFGCYKDRAVRELPFPQIKGLTQSADDSLKYILLIPVLNQPLSSNRYYAIDPHGKHKGEAFACSTEDDKAMCCFYHSIKDVKPRSLDPRNIYQQFQIVPNQTPCSKRFGFFAVSIAQDGFPPRFFLIKGWSIYTRSRENIKIDVDAQGLDSKLRARFPEFDDLSISLKSSQPCRVGKWYCPFVFVKEGTLRDQVERSMYYEMTLEQRWEQIFTCQKNTYNNPGNSVAIDALLEKEEVFVREVKALWSENNVANGVIWFMSYGPGGGETRVGLRVEVVERMK